MARFVLAHPDPAAPAVQKRDVARGRRPTIRRRAASPRRRTATCWCSSASTDDKGKLRTRDPGRRRAPHGRFFGSTAGEGGWRVCIVDTRRRAERRRRQRAAEDPRGAAAARRCCCWSAMRPAALLPTIRSRCRRLAAAAARGRKTSRARSPTRCSATPGEAEIEGRRDRRRRQRRARARPARTAPRWSCASR